MSIAFFASRELVGYPLWGKLKKAAQFVLNLGNPIRRCQSGAKENEAQINRRHKLWRGHIHEPRPVKQVWTQGGRLFSRYSIRDAMKNLILLAVFGFGAFQMWERFGRSAQPIYDESYVAVYGRNSCGLTRKFLSELESSGVNYHYFSVDDQSVANTLHSRMESSGISTRRYHLPVIDVNGDISVRPEFQKVLSEYNDKL